MELIWCIRRGKDRGFRNELTACVACHCRFRKQCQPYAELTMDQITAANVSARNKGHEVAEPLPLFEAAMQQQSAANPCSDRESESS